MCCCLAFAQQGPSKIKISVMQGDGVTNVARHNQPQAPIIKVEDSDGHPIENAKVTFRVPNSGASAVFKNGERAFTATTGRDGRAEAAGFTPNAQPGQFNIQVAIEYQGDKAETHLMQTNAARAGGNGKAIAILIAAGAAVVVGVIVIFKSVQKRVGK
jgi:hypothetical protein